jgi:hypothetical protein
MAAALLLLGLQFDRRRKHATALLSRRLLETDFPAQHLERLSLYHIAEIYGERLQIPSLVDVLFHQDQWARWGLIAIFGLLYVINPLSLSTPTSLLAAFVIYRTINGTLEIQKIYCRLI